LVVMDKRHGFPSCLRCCGEIGYWEIRLAPYPADDRDAAYVRSVAAVCWRSGVESARGSGWRSQASAPAFPTLAMAGSSEVRACGGRCARVRLRPRRRKLLAVDWRDVLMAGGLGNNRGRCVAHQVKLGNIGGAP
jgi:hypothetical protein